MKIALILMPWCRRESPSPELAMTAGILRRHGHDLEVFDVNNEIFSKGFKQRRYWKFFLLDAPEDEREKFLVETEGFFKFYASEVIHRNFDAVVIKCVAKNFNNSLEMAKCLKAKDPALKVILTPQLIIEAEGAKEEAKHYGNDSPLDFLICGEDDIALPALISAIENNRMDDFDLCFNRYGKVVDCIMGPIAENMDDLPFYDFSDYDFASYRFPKVLEIYTSRGCPRRCSFCIDWLTEKKYRSFSSGRIFDEVIHQLQMYPEVDHFRFCDKTINGDIKALEGFCGLVIKRFEGEDPRFSWSGDAMVRPEMTRDFLAMMNKARCVGLGYGIESGSQEVLDSMRKGFSVGLAEEVLKNTHDAGITTSINIMAGFPTEKERDLDETIDFLRRNACNIDEVRLTYSGCRIYEHSLLHNSPGEYNIGTVDSDSWVSADGANNTEERCRRAEKVCRAVLALGLELRVNSRPTKKAGV